MSPALRRWVFRAALLATLLLLLTHAAEYRFLTDDAFVSFRYARNLAAGEGLVFNPGFEPVEGYTNFLWVLLLAGFQVVGLAAESVAHILTLGLTVILWGIVAWFACRDAPDDSRLWLALVPPLFLAATRSVAVWSTSGLETRLFEVLVVGGVLRLALETRAGLEGGREPRPISALLLALATLTRPDGLLVAGASFAVVGLTLVARRRLPVRWATLQVAIYGSIVGAHYLFRRLYHGDWFPNTYYAKVGGESWWSMGFDYLSAFVLEYAVWLWLPLLIAGVLLHRRRGSLWLPALYAAVVAPHVLYIVSIGGDHFEFRPFDLYFPLLFLLILDGARHLVRDRKSGLVVTAYLAIVLVGLLALPWQSHRQFPGEYLTGFPGEYEDDQGEVFLQPENDPLHRWPILRSVAGSYRTRLMRITEHFVGLRQEEHVAFLRIMVGEGRRLRALVDQGRIPRDTYVAINSVGAVPYISGLRTLDRLGLTDRVVARSEMGERRRLAHDKHATIEYAAERGVDLWAVHPVHLLFRLDDPEFIRQVLEAHQRGDDSRFADVGEGYYLLCRLPRGPAVAAARFPGLRLEPAADRRALLALLSRAQMAYASAVSRRPDAVRVRATHAEILRWLGRTEESVAQYTEVVRRHPEILQARNNLGLALLGLGRVEEAIDELRRALEIESEDPIVHFNLGAALEQAGRVGEAIDSYRRAIDCDEGFVEAHRFLCVALRRQGRAGEAAEHCAAAGMTADR